MSQRMGLVEEGALDGEEGSMGMGREGSGGIQRPLPKHLGHETGSLCRSSPPCEWQPVDLH